MTVSSRVSSIIYVGDNLTTEFDVPFRFLEDQDLQLSIQATDGTVTNLVLNSDYTVTGANSDNGGKVHLTHPAPAQSKLSILRVMDLLQETDYRENERFPAESHERALDKLTMEVQQLQEQSDRAIKVDVFSDVGPDVLIGQVERVWYSIDNIDIVANDKANIDTVALNIADVNTTVTNIADVNTVAGISTQVVTVAGIASDVSAVAGDINRVDLVADNISSVNTVAVDISNIIDVAANKTNIDTVAGISSDVTTVVGISANVSTVAANDTNITTVANNISDVNTAATNIEAIKDAPNAATIAANSATASVNSATASAASANNSHIWAEGTDAQVQALGGVHSSKVWAQQSTNANIALTNSPYTTNRILEIPQDIKLELNNGTLTLKAGSKLRRLTGEEYVVKNDFSLNTSYYGFNQPCLIIPSSTNNGASITNLETPNINICLSGTAIPTSTTYQYCWFFKTDTKEYYWTADKGATWERRTYSEFFPIAIAEIGAEKWTTIDQVFNGFGYIGSTTFILPGVKWQRCAQSVNYGKNADGTNASVIRSTSSVLLVNHPDTITSTHYIGVADGSGAARYTSRGSKIVYYDESKNAWYNDYSETYVYMIPLLEEHTTAGRVDSFTPYSVDSIANSNASNFSQAGKSYLSGLGMPNCVNAQFISNSFSSGTNFTAPSNGYFLFRAGWKSAGGIIVFMGTVSGSSLYAPFAGGGFHFGSVGPAQNVFLPVKKGNRVEVQYDSNTNLTLDDLCGLWFIPAEGEN